MKTNSKRRYALVAVAMILSLIFVATLFGCGNDMTETAKCTVTFMNGNTQFRQETLDAGSFVAFPATPPTKTGDGMIFTFLGWTLSPDNNIVYEGQTAPELVTEYTVDGNVVFYAVFDARDAATYVITFVDGLDNTELGQQIVSEGESAVPPTDELKEHPGYEFSGWRGKYQNVTASATVTAEYSPIVSKVIIHELGEVREESHAYGTQVSLPAPEDSDQNSPVVFDGYFSDPDFIHEEPSEFTMGAEDKVLYAGFHINFGSANIALRGEGVEDVVDEETGAVQPTYEGAYGNNNYVEVADLGEKTGLTYSYQWLLDSVESGSEAQCPLTNAGQYTVAVELTATYKNLTKTVKLTIPKQVNIKKAPLVATMTLPNGDSHNGTVTYGEAPEITFAYSGFKYQDSAESLNIVPSFTFTLEKGDEADMAQLHAGTYTVGAELTGDLDNYEVGAIGSGELTVNKKTIEVSATVDNHESLVYGMAIEPKISATFEYSDDESALGTKGEDYTFTFSKNGESFTLDGDYYPVGSYIVSVNFTDSESIADYNVQVSPFEFTIAKKALNIVPTPVAGTELTYGDVKYDDNFLSVDWQSELVEEGDIAISTTLRRDSAEGAVVEKDGGYISAGNYVITATFTTTDENYEATIENGNFTVKKRDLTATAKPQQDGYTYGENVTFKVEFDGFAEELDESEALARKASRFTVTKEDGEFNNIYRAGTYFVAVTVEEDDNYNITPAEPTRFTVAPKAIDATITFAGNKLTSVYADALVNHYIAYGDGAIVNGDDIPVTFVFEKDGATYSDSERLSVGTYTVGAEFDTEDYVVTAASVQYEITARELTVNIYLQASSATYGDGDRTSESTFNVLGLANGDEGIASAAQLKFFKEGEDEPQTDMTKPQAGKYVAKVVFADDMSNFDVKNNSANFTVNKKQVTLTVTTGSSVYNYGRKDGGDFGEIVPTVSYGNLAYGEQPATVFGEIGKDDFVYTSNGEPYVRDAKIIYLPHGTYEIGLNEIENANYDVNIAKKTITINKVAITYTGKTYLRVSMYSGDNYRAYINKQSFAGNPFGNAFSVSGEFMLNDYVEVEKTFTVNGSDLSEDFSWVNPLTISYGAGDGYVDATDNFEVTYDFELNFITTSFSIEINSESGVTYDGNEHKFEITAQSFEEKQVKIVYNVDGDPVDKGKVPTFVNAGTYNIHYVVSCDGEEEQGDVEFVINKAQSEIKYQGIVNNAKLPYKAAQYVYNFSDDGSGNVTATFGSIDVDFSGATGNNAATEGKTLKVRNAGTYVVKLKVENDPDGNYIGKEETFTIEIVPVDYKVILPASTMTYSGGTVFPTVTVDSIEEGANPIRYEYKVTPKNGAAGDWSATLNVKNTGDYTIEYRLSPANNNYNETTGSYTVQITAEQFNFSVSPELTSGYSRGAKVGKSMLTAGGAEDFVKYEGDAVTLSYYIGSDKESAQEFHSFTEWQTSAPEFTNAGKYVVHYVLTAQNYETKEGEYTVTITKKQLTVKQPGNKSGKFTVGMDKLGEAVTINEDISEEDPDAVTVTYSYTKNGQSMGAIPDWEQFGGFDHAGKYVVTYVIATNDNYSVNVKGGSYTVDIAKGKATLTRNVQESDSRFTLTYTGVQQTISIINLVTCDMGSVEVKYTTTAGSVSVDKTELNVTKYSEFANGTAKLTVAVEGTDDYDGDSVVYTFTMAKGTYGKGAFESNVPSISGAISSVMRIGKTLQSVTIGAGWKWKNTSAALLYGNNSYDAIYNADPANMNDYATKVAVDARKEKLTVTMTGSNQSKTLGSFNATNFNDTFYMTITGEDGRTVYSKTSNSSAEKTSGHLDPGVTTNANYNVGGTYYVKFTLGYETNEYFELTGATTEKAVWLKLTSVTYTKDKTTTLGTIEDAIKEASSGTIIIVNKGTTSFMSKETATMLGSANPYNGANYYTVKSGVTLLVPLDGNNSAEYGNEKNLNKNSVTVKQNGAYAKLIVPELTNTLTVEGSLIVNAMLTSSGGATSTVSEGNYGEMEVKKNARIQFNSGSLFVSMGFTYGEGYIEAISASTVIEPMALYGWKGGTISTGICGTVFPINSYSMNSIIVKTKVNNGATYKLRATVTAAGVTADENITLVGSGGFLALSSGYLEKWVDETNGKVNFDVHGNMQFNNISIEKSLIFGLGGLKISTADSQVPLPGNFYIKVSSGTTTVPNGVRLKLLPGSTIEVVSGAKVVVSSGAAVYAYGSKNYTLSDGLTAWQDGGNNKKYPISDQGSYYRIAPTSGWGYGATTPAVIKCAGTIEVSGTLAATITGVSGGRLTLNSGSTRTGSLKEDYNPASSDSKFFTTTFNLNDSKGNAISASKTF